MERDPEEYHRKPLREAVKASIQITNLTRTRVSARRPHQFDKIGFEGTLGILESLYQSSIFQNRHL